MIMHINTAKKSLFLVSLVLFLQGCGEDNPKPLEQGHSGPTIDVARDVKTAPQEH